MPCSARPIRLIQPVPPHRRGATCILVAILLLAFVMAAAVTVDFAQMQLVRTELRSASDAAAKAGAEALARTQNPASAKAAAIQYANANRVGGAAFQLRESDVILGRVSGKSNGAWEFSADTTPYNAVRINARVGGGGLANAVPTFFGGVLGRSTFSTSQQSTAAQQDVEVCLCLDRSGSMMFDMTGSDWSYPSGNPRLYASGYYPNSLYRNYCSPPDPDDSRWEVLVEAIDLFLDEVEKAITRPRTALVTWSNEMTLPYYPNISYQTVRTDHDLPTAASFKWSDNRSGIESSLSGLSSMPLGGGTNLAAGIDEAVDVLTGPRSRTYSSKIMIVLTDGQWNAGREPLLAAQDAARAGITIHTISMLTSTQTVLSQIAGATGGKYYPTSNEAQLQEAFREIAKTLPVVLVD
jgi:Ca-activated chloride channel homolog